MDSWQAKSKSRQTAQSPEPAGTAHPRGRSRLEWPYTRNAAPLKPSGGGNEKAISGSRSPRAPRTGCRTAGDAKVAHAVSPVINAAARHAAAVAGGNVPARCHCSRCSSGMKPSPLAASRASPASPAPGQRRDPMAPSRLPEVLDLALAASARGSAFNQLWSTRINPALGC